MDWVGREEGLGSFEGAREREQQLLSQAWLGGMCIYHVQLVTV